MKRLIIAVSFMIACSLLLPPIISAFEAYAERQEVKLLDPEPDTQSDSRKT